jgi:hypothetical protein
MGLSCFYLYALIKEAATPRGRVIFCFNAID